MHNISLTIATLSIEIINNKNIMKKIKLNLAWLHPINVIIASVMLAIVLLIVPSACNNKTNEKDCPTPVKKIAYINFHFDCMIDCIWDGSNIVIEYSDGSDYSRYNTISDSLFTNYICVNVPDSIAHQLIEDYKDWYATDDTLYAMHLEYRWYIEEVVQDKTVIFTLKKRTNDE